MLPEDALMGAARPLQHNLGLPDVIMDGVHALLRAALEDAGWAIAASARRHAFDESSEVAVLAYFRAAQREFHAPDRRTSGFRGHSPQGLPTCERFN